jgi:putative ABC transport system permease protein
MILYFKQAWNLIRQEKLFSLLYIIGTGLSITVVMVLSIVYYIRIADVYPETNRSRMLIAKSGIVETATGSVNSAFLSYRTVETCFLTLQDAEAVSAVYEWWGKTHYVQMPGSPEQRPVTVRYVDNGFWKVFSFRFLRGAPFSESDFQSGIRTAVLSESTSRRLFGTIDAVGQYVSLNFMPYRVCGVVKDVSFVTPTTFAQLWIPYTVDPDYKNSFADENVLGQFGVYVLAASTGDLGKLRHEVLEKVRKLNGTLSEGTEFKLLGQPDRHWESTFRVYNTNETPDFTKIFLRYGLIFLVLLLIPGISLSGMTDSRMERRLSEIGIRRAFGAPTHTLIRQIFMENFLFTFLGGMSGLIFSYLLILISSDWITSIGQSWILLPPDDVKVSFFTPDMLINIPVFLTALGVCFLLNVITALIPAWRASHRDIIFSLNAKS